MSLYRHHREGNAAAVAEVLGESDSRRVRRRAAEVLGDLDGAGEEAVEALVAAANGDAAVGVRAAAVDALDRIGGGALEEFVATVEGVDAGDRAGWAAAREYVGALSAERPEVRMAAATVLGRIGDPEAVGPLVDLLDDPEPQVRSRGARALGRIRDRRATDALGRRLDDPSPAVRRAAAVALGALGGDVVAPLVDALDDGNQTVRRAAVDGLGDVGDPAAVAPLVDVLDDGSETVRRAAVVAVVDLLASAPGERSHEMRESVVAELREMDDATAVEPLVDLLAESKQPRQRRNTAWLLGRVAGDDDRAVGALIDALDDDDDAVSRFAATGLAEMGAEADVEARLLDALDEASSPDARAMAAFTLGKVGGERARERLDALVDETDDDRVRQRALGALSKLGGR
jgi:HEAT repeat protein